jgi:hypothetical protein
MTILTAKIDVAADGNKSDFNPVSIQQSQY